VSPGLTRSLARKIAAKRTCCYIGFSSAKHFHGDLQERSLLLAMALTGNWGKPGTGFNQFLIPIDHIELLIGLEKPATTWELLRLRRTQRKLAKELREKDPEITDELVATEFHSRLTQLAGIVPPVFWMYNQVGYRKLWDRKEWNDPSQDRTFGEYLRESVERQYWNQHQAKPTAAQEPKVLMLMAHNPLRRERSGRQMYLEELFPKLDLIFGIETRMSSSAAFADILLPAAWYYEKADLTITFALNRYVALIEQAVEPRGEARPEWEIWVLLAEKIGERARVRGMTSFRDRTGAVRQYADLRKRFTIDGHLSTQEDVVEEFVRINEKVGTFPNGTTLKELKRRGQVPFAGFGAGYQKHAAAADLKPTEPYTCLKWHLDQHLPYPTYARRAQFYIEHEWYLEAGEALPTHKETPPVGGMHPFRIVSGHVRGSIHSLHIATPELARLHRGQPVLFVNDRVAEEKGIADGDMVRVFNDVGDFEVMTSTSAAVGPDQVVIYMWEPYQFVGWKSHDSLLVGMPKGIHMAGSYGQLRHFFGSGTPTPASDRGLRVDFERV
jgi:anaerobic selenocysteine-containing dehydrogenase